MKKIASQVFCLFSVSSIFPSVELLLYGLIGLLAYLRQFLAPCLGSFIEAFLEGVKQGFCLGGISS